ncbi:GEVED domain-containing protein [Flavobacterium sp.]|jgi:hypothetical protein|uniref:GEVED domain-containing protein n=1 Tax=Flavobacterium sp. TaxID=239 RepID=UPI00391B2ED6
MLASLFFFNFLSAQSTSPFPYCDSHYKEKNYPFIYAIKSITLGDFTNITNGQFSFPHYVFYNNLSTPSFVKGSSYSISLSFDLGGTAGYGIWIDYNQNDNFEESEKVFGTSSSPLHVFNSQVSGVFTIPSKALIGLTRMRVRVLSDDNYFSNTSSNFSILPCNLDNQIMNTGETEDYNIFITSSSNIKDDINSKDLFFFLYPPKGSILNFSDEIDVNKEYEFKIINFLGSEIQSGVVNKERQNIDISLLLKGIYKIQLFQKNLLILQKKIIII